MFGSYIAGADQIGAVNFRPEVGDEYYIVDVEWYVIGDDDCISGLSPLTITTANIVIGNDEGIFNWKVSSSSE